jgi:hypothetical protein
LDLLLEQVRETRERYVDVRGEMEVSVVVILARWDNLGSMAIKMGLLVWLRCGIGGRGGSSLLTRVKVSRNFLRMIVRTVLDFAYHV